MQRVTLETLLGEILARDSGDLGPGFALTRANGVEPVDVARLVLACEEAFHLTLHDELVAQWRTLGDASLLIARLLEEGQSAPVQRSEADRQAWFYEDRMDIEAMRAH